MEKETALFYFVAFAVVVVIVFLAFPVYEVVGDRLRKKRYRDFARKRKEQFLARISQSIVFVEIVSQPWDIMITEPHGGIDRQSGVKITHVLNDPGSDGDKEEQIFVEGDPFPGIWFVRCLEMECLCVAHGNERDFFHNATPFKLTLGGKSSRRMSIDEYKQSYPSQYESVVTRW